MIVYIFINISSVFLIVFLEHAQILSQFLTHPMHVHLRYLLIIGIEYDE